MRKVSTGTDNGRHLHSSELKNVIIGGVWYTGADARLPEISGRGRS